MPDPYACLPGLRFTWMPCGWLGVASATGQGPLIGPACWLRELVLLRTAGGYRERGSVPVAVHVVDRRTDVPLPCDLAEQSTHTQLGLGSCCLSVVLLVGTALLPSPLSLAVVPPAK